MADGSPGRRGRSARPALERTFTLLAALSAAGAQGATTSQLRRALGRERDADFGSQLIRDVRVLREAGWAIDTVGASEDGEGVYRLTPGDNRFRLTLSAEEQAELHRAALIAGGGLAGRLGAEQAGGGDARRPAVETSGADGAAALDVVFSALDQRCVLAFEYRGVPRRVHPAAVRERDSRWYLVGLDEADGQVKTFRVAAIADPVKAAPGSARPVAAPEELTLHPLLWRVDPPAEVTVTTSPEYVPDVVRLLREPDSAGEGPAGPDGEVRLVYTVTHRAAFRHRLYVLGPRVRVAGPRDFRDELLAELAELAGV